MIALIYFIVINIYINILMVFIANRSIISVMVFYLEEKIQEMLRECDLV